MSIKNTFSKLESSSVKFPIFFSTDFPTYCPPMLHLKGHILFIKPNNLKIFTIFGIMSDQQKWLEKTTLKGRRADSDRWFIIFIDFAMTWKKKRNKKINAIFLFFFANIYVFYQKYKNFALFSIYLKCAILFFKIFSCQSLFREDCENRQRNVGKSILTTEMTSPSIFQELFFFSKRKKINGNIFFQPISTTNTFFSCF